MVVPLTIWAGTLVTTAEPLLAVEVRGTRVTLLPMVLLVPARRVPLLPARRVAVGWVCWGGELVSIERAISVLWGSLHLEMC